MSRCQLLYLVCQTYFVVQETSITWCDLFRPSFGRKTKQAKHDHITWRPRAFKTSTLGISHAVTISSQICGSKSRRVFTLGDGCWLRQPYFAVHDRLSLVKLFRDYKHCLGTLRRVPPIPYLADLGLKPPSENDGRRGPGRLCDDLLWAGWGNQKHVGGARHLPITPPGRGLLRRPSLPNSSSDAWPLVTKILDRSKSTSIAWIDLDYNCRGRNRNETHQNQGCHRNHHDDAK